MVKKIFAIMLMILTICFMSACGSSGAEEQGEAESQPESTAEESTDAMASDSDTMVIYFSATGHTKSVAEKIAQITDAELYEIVPEELYTEEDIDYNDENSRATKEQNDKSVRPAFAGEVPSLEGVKTIFLGYPIWFGQEPRIMDTFVESVDFDSITVIPFCTSGSSGIGDSGKDLEQNASGGTWIDGERFGAGASEDEVRSWLDSLQY